MYIPTFKYQTRKNPIRTLYLIGLDRREKKSRRNFQLVKKNCTYELFSRFEQTSKFRKPIAMYDLNKGRILNANREEFFKISFKPNA